MPGTTHVRRDSTIERFKANLKGGEVKDEWLEQAVPFVINADHLPLNACSEVSELYKTFRLPFEKIYLDLVLPEEPGMHLFCLINDQHMEEVEEFTYLCSYQYGSIRGSRNVFAPSPCDMIIHENKLKMATYNDDDDQLFKRACQGMTSYIVSFVMLLNAQNTYVYKEVKSDRVNQKRKRKGKKLIPPVHTIRVKKEHTRYIYDKAPEDREKRKSPKEHLRRGHFRHYTDHIRWIHPVMVGDANIYEYVL